MPHWELQYWDILIRDAVLLVVLPVLIRGHLAKMCSSLQLHRLAMQLQHDSIAVACMLGAVCMLADVLVVMPAVHVEAAVLILVCASTSDARKEQ
jgi:hypothetical protein